MTTEEAIERMGLWARTKGDFQLGADIGHSSLLRRLLDGKPLLPSPPPRAYSYPWYELIEKGYSNGCEVWFPDAATQEMTGSGIVINQSTQFKLIERRGEDEAIAEYDGCRYRLWRSRPAEKIFAWAIEKAQAVAAVDPSATSPGTPSTRDEKSS